MMMMMMMMMNRGVVVGGDDHNDFDDAEEEEKEEEEEEGGRRRRSRRRQRERIRRRRRGRTRRRRRGRKRRRRRRGRSISVSISGLLVAFHFLLEGPRTPEWPFARSICQIACLAATEEDDQKRPMIDFLTCFRGSWKSNLLRRLWFNIWQCIPVPWCSCLFAGIFRWLFSLIALQNLDIIVAPKTFNTALGQGDTLDGTSLLCQHSKHGDADNRLFDLFVSPLSWFFFLSDHGILHISQYSPISLEYSFRVCPTSSPENRFLAKEPIVRLALPYSMHCHFFVAIGEF